MYIFLPVGRFFADQCHPLWLVDDEVLILVQPTYASQMATLGQLQDSLHSV